MRLSNKGRREPNEELKGYLLGMSFSSALQRASFISPATPVNTWRLTSLFEASSKGMSITQRSSRSSPAEFQGGRERKG